MTLLTRLRSMLPGAPAPLEPPVVPAPDIELTDDGFVIGARGVRWSDVARIRTYKLDLVDIDCVCVRFERDDGAALEVTEESNGFNDFMDELAAQFPSIDTDWYATVMTPAFARNEAILFERAPG